MDIFFRFHGDLPALLRPDISGPNQLSRHLERRASIKDMVESFGIPHTEIGRLMVDGGEVSFAYIPEHGDRIDVLPFTPPVDVLASTMLRPVPLQNIRFAVDVNVGKLASLLRMAGFDTLYENNLTAGKLVESAVAQGRILLTRDRLILKRKKVEFGHLVRTEDSPKQLKEVILYYGLAGNLHPFSRCMRCNQVLVAVAKEKVLPRLEPLTRRYYNFFHLCPGCSRIYWQGSHREKMEKILLDLSEI